MWRKNSRWRSPRTDDGPVTRLGSKALVLLGVALLAVGCGRVEEGVAIRNEDLATSTSIPTSPSTKNEARSIAPGIRTTTRIPLAADSVTCPQPPRVPRGIVRVADLVAIHVQAPAGTDGFDAASKVLTEDFAVEIP